MGREHGGAAAAACSRGPLEAGTGGSVHAAGGLVEEEDIGASDGDRGDRDPLPLAAGEGARMAIGEVREVERVEPAVDRAGSVRPSRRRVSLSSARTVGAKSRVFGSCGTYATAARP